MFNEKRKLENYKKVSLICLFINLLGNIIFYISYSNTFIMESLVISIICILFSFIGLIRLKNIRANKEIKKKISLYMLYNKISISMFILYGLFTILLIKNNIVVLSSFFMIIASLEIYSFSKRSKIYKYNDIQLKWQRAWKYRDFTEDDSSLWWRVKLWFDPRERVSFIKRIKRYNLTGIIVTILVIPILYYDFSLSILVFLLAQLYLGQPVLYFIDLIFGGYVKTKGICTDIVKHGYGKSNGGDSIGEMTMTVEERGFSYYTIYVTNFNKRREIKFNVYDSNFIEIGKEIEVVHGIFSKRVIGIRGYMIKLFN